VNNDYEILNHTLGINEINRESYRNHFVAGKGHSDMPAIERLCNAGLMAKGRTPRFCDSRDIVFHVTDEGKKAALEALPKPIKLTRSQQNYSDYLSSECSESFAEWMGFT